ncbi:hypothetical protein ARSEF4850_006944 [Beauveria asiatica]
MLSSREIKITETYVATSVHHVAAKQHRSYEARLFRMTLAFRKQATDRAASWRLLSEAALYSDAEYATSGVVRGPLHGRLGSLKNCLKIVGTDARIGCAAFAN